MSELLLNEQIYIHGALKTRSVRVLRPFLSLAFTMLAMLCGLMEIGNRISHDNDVIAGFAIGIVVAVYLVCVIFWFNFILYFRYINRCEIFNSDNNSDL